MRVDGLVNYSSYMQHFNPLDTRPVADQSANEAASSLKPVKSAEQTAPVQEKESDGVVLRKAAGNIAGKVGANNGRTPLEDIEVDFGGTGFSGFESGEIRKAISDMEKDSMLHEYQYFIGRSRPETLVDNEDGMVTRLSA